MKLYNNNTSTATTDLSLEDKDIKNLEGADVPASLRQGDSVEREKIRPHDIWGGVNYYQLANKRRVRSSSRIF